jgi:hypothetical protein
MRADTTRDSFQATKHYRHVLQQQGRVSLDAEWNEQRSIDDHLRHSALRDVLGDSAGPLDGSAFAMTAAGGGVTIGPGRYYAGGVLLENEAAVPLDGQPDMPSGIPVVIETDGDSLEPPAAGVYIAELDTWTRHVTALDDSEIREIAVPVPDTTTRARTIWQVRLVRVGGPGASITCASVIAEWNALRAPTTGRLRVRAEPGDDTTTPCEVPAGAGYRGPDNQHYRVEIREPGDTNDATFVWSRENASVQARWVGQSGNRLTVKIPSRDDVRGFSADDWIELVDDVTELSGQPGTMVQIDTAHDDIIEIRPATRIPASATIDFTTMGPHPKVRRWEGPPQDTRFAWTALERGVQVSFEGSRSYRTGEYWSVPARTALHDVTWPQNGTDPELLRPEGPDHRYTRLAVLEFDGTNWVVLEDCRPVFPPLTELTSFFYVGGDGQEVMPDASAPNAPTPVPLPQRLEVGVANGSHPVQGATVRFEISNPAVAGTVNGQATFVDVPTNADGVASCEWAIASSHTKQQVRATLRVDGEQTHLPINFSALLSRADGVRYFPPAACATLAPAHDAQSAIDRLAELVHLSYVSGDAQEVAPADRANLQPLQVRVWSDCGPIPGARVDFKLFEHGDSIAPAQATTDDAGLASANWVLDATNQRQRAIAILSDLGPNAGSAAAIHTPTASVEFIANLDLSGAPPTKPVMRILKVERGDGNDLVNDADVPVSLLFGGPESADNGIVITTDRVVDPNTIAGKATNGSSESTNSHPTCYVTIDLPWPVTSSDVEFWQRGDLPIGFETIVLAAEVTADMTQIYWRPDSFTRQWLSDILTFQLAGQADRILARLTLKGAFIRGIKGEFLDGEPFGPQTSVNDNDLSGDDQPGGDFEMWFWLELG